MQAIGGLLAYAVLVMISVALIVLFVRGGLWLASKLLPIIDFLAEIGLIALILLLLAATVRKWRALAGGGIALVALVWALDLWLWSILTPTAVRLSYRVLAASNSCATS